MSEGSVAPAPPTTLASAHDEIGALFLDAKALDYAILGRQATVTHSQPVLAWTDELEAFSQLAGASAARARDLYMFADPGVSRRATEKYEDWKEIMRSGREG